VLTQLRRLLSRRISVEAMIEFGMWLAVPYILIGCGWSFLNADDVGRLETELGTLLPAGANLVAFGITTALWPLALIAPNACTA
jgi:hypothetical protein